jgi:hypothetical protein
MADPRFSVVRDQRAVPRGSWLALEKIGFLSGGVSTSDFCTSYEDGVKFLNFYCQSGYNGGGDARGLYMRLRLSGAGTGGGEAIRAYTEVNAALTTGGAHGIHSTLSLTATGSEAGLGAGARATLEAAAATRTLTGTYCALQLDSNIAAGNTVDGQKVAFIRLADVGAVKMPYFMDLGGLVAGDTAAAYQEDSGAVGTVKGYLRVLAPDGSVAYLVVYASHS